jgi:hypothetical protein
MLQQNKLDLRDGSGPSAPFASLHISLSEYVILVVDGAVRMVVDGPGVLVVDSAGDVSVPLLFQLRWITKELRR